MTISSISSGSNSNVLSILAQASQSTAQETVTTETAAIDKQIQNRLNAQIAALQPPADNAASNALQAQITSLQTQQTQIAALSPKYGANGTVLSELQNQLADLQVAAQNGDSASFDAALSEANALVGDLTPVNAPAPLQADGIAGLQGQGLGIGNSSQYDLSTPAGQAAAEAAVSAAQTAVGTVFGVTGANQLLANDLSTALSSQISALQSQQQQQQGASQTSTQNEITRLTNLAQTQEHLIELALGNTTTLASSIFAADNPPATVTSPLQVLENQVGATAKSSTNAANANPPILSLLG